MTLIEKGLIVGNVIRYTQRYHYVIIPKFRDDIDVLWTVLPVSAVKLYRVESRVVVDFFEGSP